VSYAYDHRGLKVSTTLPDSTVTNTAYDESGQAIASWGSQTYPTYTTYDYADRIKTLRTNSTLSSGVPTNAGGSVTTWNYSDTTGWLTSKLDNSGNGPTFTHTNAGRQSTRTWDRGKHTIYDYVNGRQVAVRHLVASGGASDADTPDVGIIYTRMGQPERMVTSSTANLPGTSIEYTFGAPGLNVTQETTMMDPDLTFSVDGSGVSVTEGTVAASIERVLDRKTDSLLRYTGADLRKPDTSLVVGQTLAYHADSGRLDTVTGKLNGTNRAFTYAYQGNSYGLIASVTGPVHTVTNTWEGTRNVLDKKENKVGATNISTYDYSVNSIGQRGAVDVSGSAFGTQADWNWGYNGFGEIESAQHVNTGNSSRYYGYDSIGNRVRHREKVHGNSGGDLTEYFSDAGGSPTAGANALNQYGRITLPSSTTVDPTYDSDGNMTSGPTPNAPTVLATFTWDGENRQLSVTPNGGSTTTALRDAMGRRVAKTTGSTRTYFLYDGWNIAAEYTGTVHTTGSAPALTLERTHVWGADLSGSLQGAGGVGGLLATCLNSVSGAPTYYPTYDGNGNVTEYLDGSGAVQVHFEYDPFGNTLVNTDTNSYFPFRFSTKYLDAESGMYYYGYRYFDPLTGRWPSHDPIGEDGGVNLYGMVENDPVNRVDYLGQAIVRTKQEMMIDVDGAPNAYHPDNIGLDHLANAGSPGNWYGIVTDKAGTADYKKGTPVIQSKTDPFPGYYVSPTSLQDTTKAHSDPARYVDARFVPYIVHYRSDRSAGSTAGDFATVVDTSIGRVIHAIVGDAKGNGSGEASMRLAWLFGVNNNPRNGGTSTKKFCYIIYEGSRKSPAWPVQNVTILSEGSRLYREWKEKNPKHECACLKTKTD
jgi:RHS repeat-associated protein